MTQSLPASADLATSLHGVRVLMVGIGHLSTGVATELRNSPLICTTAQRLDADELGQADIVLVADARQLARVGSAMQALTQHDSKAPPVVVMADPMALPFGADTSLDPVFVLPTGSDEAVARQLLRCVASTLVKRGSVLPGQDPRAGTSLRPRRGAAPSRRPSHFPWKAVVSTTTRPLDTLAAPVPASGVRDTGQVPGPPRLPQSWMPQGSSRSIPTLRRSNSHPGELHSLMPPSLSVEGSRWLVLDHDVARAHAIATCLESLAACVEVSGLEPNATRMQALRALDATGLLVAESSLGSIAPLLRRFESDPRLRHVPVVPVRWSTLFDEETGKVEKESLQLLLLPHWQPEHDLLGRLFAGYEVELARVGTAKLLRAAAQRDGHLQLHFECPPRAWSIELLAGSLLSISIDDTQCSAAQCGEALDSLLELNQGRVRCSPSNITTNRSVLGSVSGVLRIHAVHGAPLATRLGESPLRRAVSELRRVATDVAHSAVSHGREWWQRHPNTAALGAGVLCTSAVLYLLLAGQGPPTQAAIPGDEQHLDLAAAREASGPSLAPGANGPNHDADPLPSPQATRAHPIASTGKGPSDQQDRAPLGGLPQGCSRWLSAHQLDNLQPAQALPATRLAGRAVLVGDLAKAEELLCLSVAMDPTGPGAAGLVRFHFSQDNVEAATHWAEWAIEKQPTDAEVKQLLADVRNRQGRVDEARALLHDAMNVSAADVRVLRQVARQYAQSGYKAFRALDPGQAERLFRRATALDPSNALAAAGMSQVSLRRGNVAEALRHAQTAVELEPHSFEAQLALGDAYAEHQNLDLAKKAWLEAARIRPSSREARTRLGL